MFSCFGQGFGDVRYFDGALVASVSRRDTVARCPHRLIPLILTLLLGDLVGPVFFLRSRCTQGTRSFALSMAWTRVRVSSTGNATTAF